MPELRSYAYGRALIRALNAEQITTEEYWGLTLVWGGGWAAADDDAWRVLLGA